MTRRTLPVVAICAALLIATVGCQGAADPTSGETELSGSTARGGQAAVPPAALAAMKRHLERLDYRVDVIDAADLPVVSRLHGRMKRVPGDARPEGALSVSLGAATGYVYHFNSPRTARRSLFFFFRRSPDGDGITTCGRTLYFVDLPGSGGQLPLAEDGRRWASDVNDFLSGSNGCRGGGSAVIQ